MARNNADGTTNVRVALTVQVDLNAWARSMMGENPDDMLASEIRRDVKKQIRNRIAEWPMAQSNYDEETSVPIGDVYGEGL